MHAYNWAIYTPHNETTPTPYRINVVYPPHIMPVILMLRFFPTYELKQALNGLKDYICMCVFVFTA